MTKAEDYEHIFLQECENTYPAMDEVEKLSGFSIGRARLEEAAAVLACPLKANPPNWQHGRLIYSKLRAYIDESEGLPYSFKCLDIGTAKGFSALCAQWALDDARADGLVTSVDVIDPLGTERRNTVAELDGPRTLREILAPWPENARIAFLRSSGVDYLRKVNNGQRVHFAFADGKHSADVVRQEAEMIADCQMAGDITIFDDVQIEGVAKAVASINRRELKYHIRVIELKDIRKYAVATRC